MLAGAVKATLACALPAVATPMVGAPGTVGCCARPRQPTGDKVTVPPAEIVNEVHCVDELVPSVTCVTWARAG